MEDGKIDSSHHHKRRIEYFPSLTLGNPRPGVLQQLVQRPPGVPYPLAVLAVHHEHEAAGPGRVVVPQHADPRLAANVPHLTEAALLNRHFNKMHGKQSHLIICNHFFRLSHVISEKGSTSLVFFPLQLHRLHVEAHRLQGGKVGVGDIAELEVAENHGLARIVQPHHENLGRSPGTQPTTCGQYLAHEGFTSACSSCSYRYKENCNRNEALLSNVPF